MDGVFMLGLWIHRCPHLPVLRIPNPSGPFSFPAPIPSQTEGQTWHYLFKLTVTCSLQTSQTKRFVFALFLRRKNNLKGNWLLQLNNDSSLIPTHSSHLEVLFLNIELAKILYSLWGQYWSLLRVFNIFKSKWQSSLNATLQSQSASSAGSTEDHFSNG